MENYLRNGLKKLNIELKDETVKNLLLYAKFLIEYNSHTNLTAIRNEEEMLEKHFLDSLLLQELIDERFEKAIDIGTGAGFPGMILAIVNPNITFVLMDSVGKKTKFLQEVKNELKLNNVEVINDRAENYINEENRESFDLGLCRGVSRLNVILEYMIPFLKVKGVFLPQKLEYKNDLLEAENALQVLNCTVENIYNKKLPNLGDERNIIKIIKQKETNRKYPRKAGKATKKPL